MPEREYFGDKDFHQIAVIRKMIDDWKFPRQICPCPIVREQDGLALSSRNALLSAEERRLAVNISRTLFISKDYSANHTVSQTRQFVTDTINVLPSLEVQYFDIVDGKSLQSVSSWEESEDIVGCITVFCGKKPIRLIDNIRYK